MIEMPSTYHWTLKWTLNSKSESGENTWPEIPNHFCWCGVPKKALKPSADSRDASSPQQETSDSEWEGTLGHVQPIDGVLSVESRT
jgi:hypothetical protein